MTNEEPPDQSPSSSLALDLNFKLFDLIAKANGWTSRSDMAAGLHISERQLYRVLARKSRPGNNFMAGLLAAGGGLDLSQLFVQVNEDDPIGRGQ